MRGRAVSLVSAITGIAGAALAWPAAAEAHAVGSVNYQFPVPLWLYVFGGAAAVAASVPAAAMADQRIGARVGENRYRPGRGLAVRAGQLVTCVLLVEIVVAGLFGKDEFTANPATILVWVDFWVGLGLVSALFGPVWDLVSPLRLLGDVVDRVSPEPPLVYPGVLGQWPTVAVLAAWGWLELCWPGGSDPFNLAVIIVLYLVVQTIGMALVGADVWLDRAELFTAFTRAMARVSPFEWYVTDSSPCRAGLHESGEAAGCAACWRDADPNERGIRWRGFTAGTWRSTPLLPGGAAFIVLLLSIVLYDGFSETLHFTNLAQWLFHHGASVLSDTGLRTLVMVIFIAPLVGVFAGVGWALGRHGDGFATAVARYAPTLMPIVAAYFAAHYLLYLFTYGQLTWKTIIDPFETDWVPDLGIWTGYPSSLVWAFQVGVIVLGHIAAIFAAHRIALTSTTRWRIAMRVQAPLIALMIAYTVLGLWILGQAYTSA